MLCGSKLVVLRVSRSLGLPGRPKEVLVKVVVKTRHRLGMVPVRARVQMGTRVTRPDQVAVRAEVVPRLQALRGMEAEVVARHPRVLQGMEAGLEVGVLPRLTLLLEVARVVDVVDLVVVLLEAHRFRRVRRDRQMTLRISLMEQGSRDLGISVVR